MNISIPIIIVLIVIALGGGYLIFKPATKQDSYIPPQQQTSSAPVSESKEIPITDNKVKAESPKQAAVTAPKKNNEVKATETKTTNTAPSSTVQPPVQTIPKSKRIDGLTTIDISSSWENWNSDAKDDGIVIKILYKNDLGDIIAPDLDALRSSFYSGSLSTKVEPVPISADVKLYTTSSSSRFEEPIKLVFSKHYAENEIIYTAITPTIRIPKGEINIDPLNDGQVGIAEVTIYTPEQGSFSATAKGVVNSIDLYEK